MSDEAECTLQALSAAIRSKQAMEKRIAARVMVPSKTLARVKQLSEEGHDHVPIQELQDVLTQFGRGINQVARDNRLLQDALTTQREETDILWWLTGACSNDMNQPFANMDAGLSAIVAGKEPCGSCCSTPRAIKCRQYIESHNREMRKHKGGALP